uniref:C2HC zinc finger plants domain-containing protein n=1 Tax=Oryza punctata TaxID=4537 RepID=A0A0E0JVT1_ORYPU
MDPYDVEMEAAEGEPMVQQAPPAAAAAAAAAGGEGWSMLSRARALLEEGKPSLALQAILLAIRSQGGEQALMQTLNRARELYRQRSQPSPSVDDLASLLAQCAIAESQSPNTNVQQAPGSDPVMMLDSDEVCILAESGRKQIILDAFADGSSFICLKCGGLFSTSRKDEHLAYCEARRNKKKRSQELQRRRRREE